MQKTTQATAKWIKLLEFIHKEKIKALINYKQLNHNLIKVKN